MGIIKIQNIVYQNPIRIFKEMNSHSMTRRSMKNVNVPIITAPVEVKVDKSNDPIYITFMENMNRLIKANHNSQGIETYDAMLMRLKSVVNVANYVNSDFEKVYDILVSLSIV